MWLMKEKQVVGLPKPFRVGWQYSDSYMLYIELWSWSLHYSIVVLFECDCFDMPHISFWSKTMYNLFLFYRSSLFKEALVILKKTWTFKNIRILKYCIVLWYYSIMYYIMIWKRGLCNSLFLILSFTHTYTHRLAQTLGSD